MKKSIVIISHVCFWFIMLLSFSTLPIIFRYLSAREFAYFSTITKLLSPVFFYTGYFGIMPLIRKRRFIPYIILTLIISYVLLFFISKEAFAYGFAPLSSLISWVFIGCLFRFFIDWFKKREERNELEKMHVESKLSLLKNQINPHFLFNTLHNIDALIAGNQEKASRALIKLSEIMRYMMYDSQPDKVLFIKEIEYIENYIELEKLRLRNPKFFSMNISGDFENVQIAPMLFIPFIENAFKHCVDSDIENGILIEFNIVKKSVRFYCENKFDIQEPDKDKSHGIGMDIVKNRLKYIYPNKHKLEINKVNDIFKVKLEIELNDN
jgi:two-component system, LytTR family, sensor kinase